MEKSNTKHKLALLTWMVIYPLITLILYVFKEELGSLPLLLRTLVLTVILVCLMNYLIMPSLKKQLGSWLKK
jgi:antibiotic biosynthesis monooxygenase (ABM) superfamily enzyme